MSSASYQILTRETDKIDTKIWSLGVWSQPGSHPKLKSPSSYLLHIFQCMILGPGQIRGSLMCYCIILFFFFLAFLLWTAGIVSDESGLPSFPLGSSMLFAATPHVSTWLPSKHLKAEQTKLSLFQAKYPHFLHMTCFLDSLTPWPSSLEKLQMFNHVHTHTHTHAHAYPRAECLRSNMCPQMKLRVCQLPPLI